MANEIQFRSGATGSTLYAILLNTVGQVWDVVGSAWATIEVANWGNYDIALAESPADSYRYQASMPAVAAGVYDILVFQQADGAPAITDVGIGTGQMEWDGAAEVPLTSRASQVIADAILASADAAARPGDGMDMVEISGDAASAAALRTVLDGTGGAVLKAAQLKLSCNVENEGALDIRNASANGHGQYNKGGYHGQKNEGGAHGQDNGGGLIGQSNTGTDEGQWNSGGVTGQYNRGVKTGLHNVGTAMDSVGQQNSGNVGTKSEGSTGYGQKALVLVEAADRIDDILADTADIQPRLAGITILANWLRGIFRKSAMDATAKGEVNAGGGTFNETTDSEEALGEKTAAIKAKTDTIGSVEATYTTPAVTPAGPWEIHCGSAYLAADGRAIEITITGYGGPSLVDAAGVLRLLARHKWAADMETTADLEVAATISVDGTTVTLSADLDGDDTTALEPSPPKDTENYRVQFVVTPAGGEAFVIGEGDLTAKKGIAAAEA